MSDPNVTLQASKHFPAAAPTSGGEAGGECGRCDAAQHRRHGMLQPTYARHQHHAIAPSPLTCVQAPAQSPAAAPTAGGQAEASAVAATLRITGVWPFDAPARAALAAALAELITSVPADRIDVLSASGAARRRRRSLLTAGWVIEYPEPDSNPAPEEARRALLGASGVLEVQALVSSSVVGDSEGKPAPGDARRSRMLLADARPAADVGLQLRATSAEVAAVAQRQLQNAVGSGQLLVRP